MKTLIILSACVLALSSCTKEMPGPYPDSNSDPVYTSDPDPDPSYDDPGNDDPGYDDPGDDNSGNDNSGDDNSGDDDPSSCNTKNHPHKISKTSKTITWVATTNFNVVG